MATELPKDKKNYIIIEPTKVTIALFTILIGLIGWLGKATYEKLTSIETDVKTLLVANGIQKTQIEDIKEWQNNKDNGRPNTLPPKKTNASMFNFMDLEFILPKDIASQ